MVIFFFKCYFSIQLSKSILLETKQAEDLDECISVALLKAKGSLVMTKLCLEWNRFDVARDLIFEEEKLDKVIVNITFKCDY